MDIIVRKVLTTIQDIPEFSNTILAGGAVRDALLELEIKDYDIFVPRTGPFGMKPLVLLQKIYDAFGPEEITVDDTKILDKTFDYKQTARVKNVYGLNILGRKIDIIFTEIHNTEDFPKDVLATFDYGLCRVYDNGSYVEDTDEHFQRDYQGGRMTLLLLEDLSYLPKSMERYNRINDKFEKKNGYRLTWGSPLITLAPTESKKKEKYFTNSYAKNKMKYTLDTEAEVGEWTGEDIITATPMTQATPSILTTAFAAHQHTVTQTMLNTQMNAFAANNVPPVNNNPFINVQNDFIVDNGEF